MVSYMAVWYLVNLLMVNLLFIGVARQGLLTTFWHYTTISCVLSRFIYIKIINNINLLDKNHV